MQCNRCQGPTKEKRIQSKKDGKYYTVHECTSGCMDSNNKFPYSFFPPRAPKSGGYSAPVANYPQKPQGNDDAILNELREIKAILLAKLMVKPKVTPVQTLDVPDDIPTDEELGEQPPF